MEGSVRTGNEILLIGDQWPLSIFADAFIQKGVKPQTLALQTPIASHPTTLPVFVGNGDPKTRVAKTFGNELTDYLWNLSEANFERAKDYFSRHKMSIYEKGLVRWEKEEVVEQEKGFSFDPGKVFSYLKADHTGQIEKIDKVSSFQIQTKLKGHTETLNAPIIVFLSDLAVTEQFSFFWDKLIPVTLATFGYSVRNECPDFSMSIHNQGADFAVRLKSEVHLGSYRNLYEDKGVGVKNAADPVTQKNCARFFGNLNWIDPDKKPEVALSIESLTCDGLPIVGTLPEAPGIYVVAGFSARTPNFIFEIAHQVANGILTDGKAPALHPLSLKRLH